MATPRRLLPSVSLLMAFESVIRTGSTLAAAHAPTLPWLALPASLPWLALPVSLSASLGQIAGRLLRRIHAGHVLTLAGSVAQAAPHASINLFHIPLHAAFAAHAASAAGARAHAFRACMVIVRHTNLRVFG